MLGAPSGHGAESLSETDSGYLIGQSCAGISYSPARMSRAYSTESEDQVGVGCRLLVCASNCWPLNVIDVTKKYGYFKYKKARQLICIRLYRCSGTCHGGTHRCKRTTCPSMHSKPHG